MQYSPVVASNASNRMHRTRAAGGSNTNTDSGSNTVANANWGAYTDAHTGTN